MGTRALTIFIDSYTDYKTKEQKEEEIAVLYRQMDGYPDCHGEELVEFLRGKKIVNGYNQEDEKKGYFNGMSNLAVQTIAHFNCGIGNFHLHPAGTRDCWEEYIYYIRQKGDKIEVTCEDTNERKKKVLL